MCTTFLRNAIHSGVFEPSENQFHTLFGRLFPLFWCVHCDFKSGARICTQSIARGCYTHSHRYDLPTESVNDVSIPVGVVPTTQSQSHAGQFTKESSRLEIQISKSENHGIDRLTQFFWCIYRWCCYRKAHDARRWILWFCFDTAHVLRNTHVHSAHDNFGTQHVMVVGVPLGCVQSSVERIAHTQMVFGNIQKLSERATCNFPRHFINKQINRLDDEWRNWLWSPLLHQFHIKQLYDTSNKKHTNKRFEYRFLLLLLIYEEKCWFYIFLFTHSNVYNNNTIHDRVLYS